MNQLNLSYGSAAKMSQDSKRILEAFRSGQRVWIGRNGYGSTQYALLNAGTRWNPASKTEYVSQFEVESLPSAWVRVLSKMLAPYLSA